ncbi:MAG: hypothetical protein HQL76_00085 [Magnetococcales bacterium]|nr:hypothetical protein [Magnetococcales bacterium]
MKAQKEGDGKEIRFKVEEIDLDLSVAATNSEGGGIGVKFWVIDAKTEAGVKSESIMKVRLKLKPTNPLGKENSDVLVSNRVRDPSA